MTDKRLDELIQKHVLGISTESEAAELSGHLERDDALEARRKLRLALRADAYLEEAAAEMGEGRGGKQKKKTSPFALERILWPLGSIAAAILFGLFIWSQKPNVEEDQAIATIRHIEGTAHSNGEPLLDRKQLLADETITIDSGMMELVFQDTDVHAIASAPISMTLHGSERVFLHRGNLKLHVPPQGIGFIVETAEREITDLGTRFVVSAEEGKSGVLVLDGLVSIDKKIGGEEQYLSEGEAATFTRRGDLKLLQQNVNKMPEIIRPAGVTGVSLPGEIYTLKPSEWPKKREPIDHLGQRFLPLIQSGFQDLSSLNGLRKRPSSLHVPGIAGAYGQFAEQQGINPALLNRSGWVSWHRGKLKPPQPGRYRFWGYADNTLLVAINGRPVFEGGRRDSALRVAQTFPRQNHPEWPCLNSGAGFASGEWFEVTDEPVQFDLLFGELQGWLTFGLLLIEREGEPVEQTYYGQPRWPLFLAGTPDPDCREQLNQLNAYLEEKLLGSFSVSDRAMWKPAP